MVIGFFRVLVCALMLGLFVAPAAAPPAYAQQSGQTLVGGWTGTHSWSNGAVVQDTWDFSADGSFTAGRPASAGGFWVQHGDSVALRYTSGAEPLFVGTLSDGVITGTTTTSDGLTGSWTMQRENGAPQPVAARPTSIEPLLGDWATGDGTIWRFSLRGDVLVWEDNGNNGKWSVYAQRRWRISEAGFIGFDPIEGNAFEVVGDVMYLHYDDDTPTERQVELRRAR